MKSNTLTQTCSVTATSQTRCCIIFPRNTRHRHTTAPPRRAVLSCEEGISWQLGAVSRIVKGMAGACLEKRIGRPSSVHCPAVHTCRSGLYLAVHGPWKSTDRCPPLSALGSPRSALRARLSALGSQLSALDSGLSALDSRRRVGP